MKSEIRQLKSELIADMTHYMRFGGAEDANDPDYDPQFDAGYTQEEIDSCDMLLESFFEELRHVPVASKDAAIMAAVKTLVLALNSLNEDCDWSLIETDQREMLCEIIIGAARHAGLQSDPDVDITEEWREW